MKILIINYEFPPLGGGAGNASYFIARELARSGHEVLVFTSRFRELAHRQTQDGYSVLRIPVVRKKIDACSIFEMMTFLLSGLFHISKVRKEFEPQITLAFFTIPCAPIAWYMKFRWDVPYLTLLRGGDVPGFKGIGGLATLVHSLTKPLTRFLWRHSKTVIANSKGLAELASKTWDGKIEIIPNGVDTEFYKPAAVKAPKDYIQLLFVGRLSEQKGLRPFLETLSDLKTETPWKLVIVGDGPLRESLETYVHDSESLSGCTYFKGWMGKEDLLKEYQQSNIFIFPSLAEGMPNAMLEAMACGLPILATRIAGNEELVIHGENGFLYDKYDGRRFELLRQMIDGNQIGAMGLQSLKIARQKSWSQSAAGIVAL